jgi:hypothetical protein
MEIHMTTRAVETIVEMKNITQVTADKRPNKKEELLIPSLSSEGPPPSIARQDS